jgi:hypothetical protein
MKRCARCNSAETDDTLKFCRADGTTLISDSGSIRGDVGTARSGSADVSSEIETSILLRTSTTPEIYRSTGPTTFRPSTPSETSTRELSKPNRFRLLLPLTLMAVVIVGVGGYFYFSRKDTTIQSIAVMPFTNASENAELDYLSDGMTETLSAAFRNCRI